MSLIRYYHTKPIYLHVDGNGRVWFQLSELLLLFTLDETLLEGAYFASHVLQYSDLCDRDPVAELLAPTERYIDEVGLFALLRYTQEPMVYEFQEWVLTESRQLRNRSPDHVATEAKYHHRLEQLLDEKILRIAVLEQAQAASQPPIMEKRSNLIIVRKADKMTSCSRVREHKRPYYLIQSRSTKAAEEKYPNHTCIFRLHNDPRAPALLEAMCQELGLRFRGNSFSCPLGPQLLRENIKALLETMDGERVSPPPLSTLYPPLRRGADSVAVTCSRQQPE